jgi:glucokinase
MNDTFLAFDIGGSFFKAALVSADGQIIHQAREAVPQSKDQSVDSLKRIAKKLLAEQAQAVIGIGIGAPGVIDRKNICIAGFSANIPQLAGVSMREVFAGISENVAMDNDATNAARGEHRWGAAQGLDDALVITLGTGIGGGLIVNGKIVYGASGYAGEFGHTIIEANGRRCTCGGLGCIEAYASAWALRERAADVARRHPESLLTKISGREIEPKDIVAAAEQGDTWAALLMREAGELLGVALASAANLFNPSAIIIGGGLAAAGSILFDPIEMSFRARVLPAAGAVCRIMPAALANDAGILGAASLILDEVRT